MRSEIKPQIWRLKNAVPSSTDSIAAPWVGVMPRSLHSATRCACGIDIGMQQQKAASRQHGEHEIRRPAEHGRPRRLAGRGDRGRDDFRRRLSTTTASGRITASSNSAKTSIVVAPAIGGDRALEDRRPERAGDVLPARDQRERRAAPPVEPAADIDVERRVQPGIAEQPDEQAVAEIERPGLPENAASDEIARPIAIMLAPNITVQRTP